MPIGCTVAVVIIIERFIDSMKTIDVYRRKVEIIKQINKYTNNNKFKRRNYNDNIYECSRHLKVIKYDMVRNSPGRLFQYFGEA